VTDTNGNNRVTLAVLGSKLDHIVTDIEEIKATVREIQEERYRCEREHNNRISDNRDNITKVSERVGIFAGLNALFAAGASIVAAVFGGNT